MDTSQVMAQTQVIFRRVLEDDTIELAESTTANDIPEWDSLNHLQLVVAIEKHFKLRFTSKEIAGWKHVGEMCQSIAGRLK